MYVAFVVVFGIAIGANIRTAHNKLALHAPPATPRAT